MENNKTLPKISIITPTLNQAEFIEKTILSVLNQNYPDLEYLVFDGCSNDGTQEILKKYSKDIKWRSEPDQGQSSAINKGLRICSGEIIGFINSDDQYEPSALLKVGNFFASHPEAMWVTGKCKIINEYEKEVFSFVSFYKHILLRFHHPSLLGVVNYIPQPSTFWRREVLETVGFFDESLRYVMDYDYWFRLSQRYRLYFINEYLSKF
ncbi:MAG: glycosyltransferase family 2 protein, partial [Bacteroidota bacterium]